MSSEAKVKAALTRGDVTGAAALGRQIIADRPDDAVGYFLLGMVAEKAGQVAKAAELLDAAATRNPSAEHLAHLARLKSLQRRDGEAGAAAIRALSLASSDPLTLDTIGCVLARLGRHEDSLAPFMAAVEGDPDNREFRYNLAAACGFTGRVEEARAHYETILAGDPGEARTHYALSILSRQTDQSNHIPRLETALARAKTPVDQLRIRYALSKENEDLGRTDAAYEHLSTANREHRRAMGYSFTADEQIFDALGTLFGDGPDLALNGTGVSDQAPIFVVGMPRTGTTLVDRILSSHPDVSSAGELQAMPLAIKRLTGTRSRTILDPETVTLSAGLDRAEIANAYLEQVAHHRADASVRFIDKLPANFLYLGYIAQALPNASIVCLRRNPMDTVWSNYKNLFASQSAYYAYSYYLMDIARYYQRFDRLMGLWDRLFPGRILQLSYEGLVADQEGLTRALLQHCRLPWDDACLAFHENAAPVATPSAAQVRRPINADAVARWRRYEKWLAPVAAWFEGQGISVD